MFALLVFANASGSPNVSTRTCYGYFYKERNHMISPLKNMGCLLLVLLLALQTSPLTTSAQSSSGYQRIRIQVYVFNQKDGTAVPGVTVFYQDFTRCGPTKHSPLPQANYLGGGETNPEGVADISEPACPGPAVIYVNAGQFFQGDRTEFTVETGVTDYQLELSLEPRAQRSSLNSNKFMNPKTRTLHIIVKGRKGNALVPVHYAAIYDRSDKLIAHTNYQGVAVVQHKEVLGETVTLRAVPAAMPGNEESWEPASASFIVGAAESGLRTTRNEDYVNIILGGNNSNAERHQIDILVRGHNPSKHNACACQRIAGARIFDSSGHVIATTDATGAARATVEAPLGETYEVKAEAQHWKPQTQQLQSGTASGVGVTYAHESADFMLEPAEEHGNLTVEVLDRETNEPVHGVEVSLYKPNHYPGTLIGRGTTGSNGEVAFGAQDIDEALLNGEARVEATHGGWESSTQTISASLINGESPRYLIYIKQKTEKTNWSGAWYDGPYTIQVSGGSGSLGYTAVRSSGVGTCCPLVDKGSGTCTVKGNTAECKWHSLYNDIPPTHDGGKMVDRSGHGTLRLNHYTGGSGDTISYHLVQDTGTITLGSGQKCPDIAQCTGMHPGSVSDGSWSRKKP